MNQNKSSSGNMRNSSLLNNNTSKGISSAMKKILVKNLELHLENEKLKEEVIRLSRKIQKQ